MERIAMSDIPSLESTISEMDELAARLRELLKPHGWTVESKPLGNVDGEMQYKYWLSETLPLWEVA